MKQELCYWANYTTPTICDKITSLAMNLEEQTPTLGFNSGDQNDSIRRSRVRWVDHNVNPEFGFVNDLMWKGLLQVNLDFYNFNVTKLPPMQFTEYDESYKGEYKMHQDVFWINPGPNHRKITLILQLTDSSEYEGGDLVFHYIDRHPSVEDNKAMKQKGSLIAFPSFIFHQLTPVTRGTRRSLVAWFEGPKFQ